MFMIIYTTKTDKNTHEISSDSQMQHQTKLFSLMFASDKIDNFMTYLTVIKLLEKQGNCNTSK